MTGPGQELAAQQGPGGERPPITRSPRRRAMAAGRSRAGTSASSTSNPTFMACTCGPPPPAARAGRPRNRARWRYMRARPGEGRRPVTSPRALARYTRGAANTVTLRLAGHLAFADLEHAGRKSGTARHTPGARVPLREHRDRRPEPRAPAGLVQNIKAAGTCRMRLHASSPPSARRRSSPQPMASRSALAGQVRAQAPGSHGRLVQLPILQTSRTPVTRR